MKRSIPRHIDGRVKVGLVPLSTFLKTLPIYFILIVSVLFKPTPIGTFFTILVLSIIYFLTSEMNNKETGLDILKDIIKYEKEGDLFFERTTLSKSESKKIIHNKINRND